MDELGLFFKVLADRGPVVKTKKIEGDKKSKQRLTATFVSQRMDRRSLNRL